MDEQRVSPAQPGLVVMVWPARAKWRVRSGGEEFEVAPSGRRTGLLASVLLIPPEGRKGRRERVDEATI